MPFFLGFDNLTFKRLDGLACSVFKLLGGLGSVEKLIAYMELDAHFPIGLFGGIKNFQLNFSYANFRETVHLAEFLCDVRVQ